MYKIELIINKYVKTLGCKEYKIDAEIYAKIKVKELKDLLKDKVWGIKIVSA